MKALNAGAYGPIYPMVNTAEDAARLVSYLRYPPNGVRSFGPTRVNFSAGADHGPHADGEVLCFAMIETVEAVANPRHSETPCSRASASFRDRAPRG